MPGFHIECFPFETDWHSFFRLTWTSTSIASVPCNHSPQMGHACLQVHKLFLPLDKVHLPMRMLYVCLVEGRHGPSFPSHRIHHNCCIVHHVIPFLPDRIRSTRTSPSTCDSPRPFPSLRRRLSRPSHAPLASSPSLRPPSASLVRHARRVNHRV